MAAGIGSTQKLGVRLIAVIGVALLPLAILAYGQATRLQTEVEAREEAALFGQALLMAQPQFEGIQRARGAAATLAIAVRPLIGDPAACSELLRRYVEDEDLASFAGFIPTDGEMVCASTGQPRSFGGSAALLDLVENPRPVITVNPNGPISGEAVVIFSHPVWGDGGALAGFLSLSLPHRTLVSEGAPTLKALGNGVPVSLFTFGPEGTILTATGGLEAAAGQVPAERELAGFIGGGTATFTADTVLGERRTFAVVPLVAGTLYVLASWLPGETVGGVPPLPLWVFPVLMCLASLLVAWIAAEYQVLRPVRALRQSMTAFARGSRTVSAPVLSNVPVELREMNAAYGQLVQSVVQDEATLEDMVRQKEILLQEVHHRVKNNLQLIVSIMSIQMRKTTNEETRIALKGLQDRVMSLASVHRELYQTSGMVDVQADDLLQRLVHQVVQLGQSETRQIDLTTHFEAVRLTADQSVPLALLMTEGLTNALKYAGQVRNGATTLAVSLKRDDDRVCLRLVNSLPQGAPSDDHAAPESTGIGQQLLHAFARQLNGTLTLGPEDDTFVMAVEFEPRPLQEA